MLKETMKRFYRKYEDGITVWLAVLAGFSIVIGFWYLLIAFIIAV